MLTMFRRVLSELDIRIPFAPAFDTVTLLRLALFEKGFKEIPFPLVPVTVTLLRLALV